MVLRGETPLGGYRYLQWRFTGGDTLGGMYGLDGAEHQGKETPGRDLPVDLTAAKPACPVFQQGSFLRLMRISS